MFCPLKPRPLSRLVLKFFFPGSSWSPIIAPGSFLPNPYNVVYLCLLSPFLLRPLRFLPRLCGFLLLIFCLRFLIFESRLSLFLFPRRCTHNIFFYCARCCIKEEL